ncbi:MAG: uroporphyrinogen decarboxylase family protein [Armatimonadota bacterium]
MTSFLSRGIDIEQHNEEVRHVLEAFDKGRPYRAPCYVSGSISNFFLNYELNTKHLEFKEFFENIDVQIESQLEYQYWQRFNLYCDREMGVPKTGWQLAVDFQNCLDAAYFGCPVVYHPGGVPDTTEILREHKEVLYDIDDPVPLKNGLDGRSVEFFEAMQERCKSLDYRGAPVLSPQRLPGEGTDGPLDTAFKLRGTENVLCDMLVDESYFHDLMGFVTRNIIKRIKHTRHYRWEKTSDSAESGGQKQATLTFADDAIALVSAEHYKEYVFPYHKMIFDELAPASGIPVHLCGDATRHFKFMVANLGVTGFDTGFPVDFGWLRKELGPDICIYGGPTIMLLKDGNRDEIDDEVRRIAESGVLDGGRFVFIAANNMAPCTPVNNIAMFYESVKRWAVYSS